MLVSGIFVRFKIARFYRLIDKLSLNTTIIPMNSAITTRAKCVHGKDSETKGKVVLDSRIMSSFFFVFFLKKGSAHSGPCGD